ncbi:MAG: XRE family transcriptional regulator [Planctomycetota bacterium]
MEFGDGVRSRRTDLGLSQGDLAERSGVSKAMVSEIESGKKNPTLRVACQIALGLDCQISDLLDLPPTVRFEKLEPDARRVLVDPETNVERHLLAPPMVRHGVQVLLFVFPPRAVVEFDADGRGVLEHISCLAGTLRVQCAGESADLQPGESLNYEASATHSIENLADEQARAFVVIDMSRRGEVVEFE